MSFIFNSNADVGIMFGLALLAFADLFAGVFFRMASGNSGYAMSDWYRKGAKRMWWMPPWWVFPLVWFVLKVLIISALYIFYRAVTLSGLYGATVDTVTLLFLFNMALNALWVPVFFDLRAPAVALVICLGILGTGAAILAYLSFDNLYWTSFWLFLWYPLWCLFALVLNVAWLVYDYRRADRKSHGKV